jgi:hypothetical protein
MGALDHVGAVNTILYLMIKHRLLKSTCKSGGFKRLKIFRATKGVFTPNAKSVLSENLGGILGGTQG